MVCKISISTITRLINSRQSFENKLYKSSFQTLLPLCPNWESLFKDEIDSSFLKECELFSFKKNETFFSPSNFILIKGMIQKNTIKHIRNKSKVTKSNSDKKLNPNSEFIKKEIISDTKKQSIVHMKHNDMLSNSLEESLLQKVHIEPQESILLIYSVFSDFKSFKNKDKKYFSSYNIMSEENIEVDDFIIDSPFIFTSKAKVGSHFEFLALKDCILLEFNHRMYEKFSMKRNTFIENKDSVKNFGFENYKYIQEKFKEITEFSLKA